MKQRELRSRADLLESDTTSLPHGACRASPLVCDVAGSEPGTVGLFRKPASGNSSKSLRTRLPAETQSAPRTGQSYSRGDLFKAPTVRSLSATRPSRGRWIALAHRRLWRCESPGHLGGRLRMSSALSALSLMNHRETGCLCQERNRPPIVESSCCRSGRRSVAPCAVEPS
jgi:hypothetical protein